MYVLDVDKINQNCVGLLSLCSLVPEQMEEMMGWEPRKFESVSAGEDSMTPKEASKFVSLIASEVALNDFEHLDFYMEKFNNLAFVGQVRRPFY